MSKFGWLLMAVALSALIALNIGCFILSMKPLSLINLALAGALVPMVVVNVRDYLDK